MFLARRTRETLDGVAAEIDADGGTAHVAVVDDLSSASGAVLKGSAEFQMGGTGPADAASESFMQ